MVTGPLLKGVQMNVQSIALLEKFSNVCNLEKTIADYELNLSLEPTKQEAPKKKGRNNDIDKLE
jgi:hypothetical protein